jgi:hypothetical protein
MTDHDDDQQESDVPEIAVQVLTDASKRAAQAGRPRVVVKDGMLVRIENDDTTVLKKMPNRKKATARSKKRRHE